MYHYVENYLILRHTKEKEHVEFLSYYFGLHVHNFGRRVSHVQVPYIVVPGANTLESFPEYLSKFVEHEIVVEYLALDARLVSCMGALYDDRSVGIRPIDNVPGTSAGLPSRGTLSPGTCPSSIADSGPKD